MSVAPGLLRSAARARPPLPAAAGPQGETGALRLEAITADAGFAALREEWTALLAASDSANLFLTWEWLNSWWKHLAGSRRLLLLAVRDRAGLAGLAPFAVHPPRPGRLIPVRAIEFLGTGMAGSDYLDVIARRGSEAPVAAAVARHLLACGLPVFMHQVAADRSVAAQVVENLGDAGWFVEQAGGDICPYVDYRGGWDDYYDALGHYHRRSLARERRRAERSHDLRFSLAATEEERTAALDGFVRLHRRRWQDAGGSQALSEPGILAFHDEISRRALARGWLRLYSLDFDAVPAAAVYGFAHEGRFYYYQSGFDPRFSRFSAGRMCLESSMKAAADEGLAEFDLLHGAEPYKFLWTRTWRELSSYQAYPPTAAGYSARRLAAARAGLKRLLRRGAAAPGIPAPQPERK